MMLILLRVYDTEVGKFPAEQIPLVGEALSYNNAIYLVIRRLFDYRDGQTFAVLDVVTQVRNVNGDNE